MDAAKPVRYLIRGAFFTWREGDPSTRKILEGGTTLSPTPGKLNRYHTTLLIPLQLLKPSLQTQKSLCNPLVFNRSGKKRQFFSLKSTKLVISTSAIIYHASRQHRDAINRSQSLTSQPLIHGGQSPIPRKPMIIKFPSSRFQMPGV